MNTFTLLFVCYQRKYYIILHKDIVNPGDLGFRTLSEIPSDPEEYRQWLAEIKAEYEQKRQDLERFLCLRRYQGQVLRKSWRTTHSNPIHDYNWDRLPTFEPPKRVYNDRPSSVDWCYILDLDDELFTLSESAHLTTKCIPSGSLVETMAEDAAGLLFFIPGIMPPQSLATLDYPLQPTTEDVAQAYQQLNPRLMEIKHPAASHDHVFNSFSLFGILREQYGYCLEKSILRWSKDHILFREITYAILCIATPNKNVSLWRSRRVLESSDAGYVDLLGFDFRSKSDDKLISPKYCQELYDPKDPPRSHTIRYKTNIDNCCASTVTCDEPEPEFVAHLGTGSHLENHPPSSSPEGAE